MAYFPHAFEGPIERHGVGRSRVIWYRVLFIPPALQRELPFERLPRLRVVAEIAEVPTAGAWMPSGDGRRYFIVSPTVIKTAGVDLGDVVEMRFRIDDQDRVDVPAALAQALSADEEASRAWASLSPGRRRGLAHLVRQAKAEATQQRRIAEVLRAVLEGGPR